MVHLHSLESVNLSSVEVDFLINALDLLSSSGRVLPASLLGTTLDQDKDDQSDSSSPHESFKDGVSHIVVVILIIVLVMVFSSILVILLVSHLTVMSPFALMAMSERLLLGILFDFIDIINLINH